MNRLRPLVLVAVSVAIVVVLFVLLRPGDDGEPTATATTETRSTTQATTSPTTTTAPTTPKPPTWTRVAIAVRGGRVIGGIRRVMFSKGARVELFVTSDVADEVHLHGYDVSRDVAPGAAARLRFRAATPGRFEVELEQRQLQIAEITVQP